MKLLDLFSGIGGFSLAGKWAGFNTIQFVEKDKFCQKVLRKHWPDVPIHDDIKTFSWEKPVTLLTGGFPCQPFSVAGKRKGINDERYLWPEMLRIIRECKPNWIIAENVPGIISQLDAIREDLEKENYQWISCHMPASAIGAPHKRERIWLTAHLNSERCKLRVYPGKEGCTESNWKQHLSQIYIEWSQFIPEPWKTFTSEDWFSYNDEFSRDNDGVSEKLYRNRIKALGNSIVPQVAFPVMKCIYEIEKQNES